MAGRSLPTCGKTSGWPSRPFQSLEATPRAFWRPPRPYRPAWSVGNAFGLIVWPQRWRQQHTTHAPRPYLPPPCFTVGVFSSPTIPPSAVRIP